MHICSMNNFADQHFHLLLDLFCIPLKQGRGIRQEHVGFGIPLLINALVCFLMNVGVTICHTQDWGRHVVLLLNIHGYYSVV